MSERTPEPGIEPEGIDSPALLIWGFVSVVVTLAVMFVAAALYFGEQGDLTEERVYQADYVDSDRVLTDQRGVLASYASPEAEGKPYKIPVTVAKKLVLAELQSEAAQ